MQAHMTWWIPDMIFVSVIAGVVFGLRVGERNRTAGIVAAVLFSCGGAVAILVSTSRAPLSLTAFSALGFLYAIAVLLNSVGRPRSTSGDDRDWKDLFTTAVYSFGLVAVVSVATHAYKASWQANAATVAVLGLAGLSLFAVATGAQSYSRRAEAESGGVPDARGRQRLAITILSGLGMVAAAVPVFVLLGRPIGIEIAGDARPAAAEWATGANIVIAVTLAALGVAIAAATRPKDEVDDRLRPNGVAVAAVAVANIGLTALVVHDVLAHELTWPVPVVVYIVLLAALVGVMYGEDLITTPVRLHLLRTSGPAWALAVLGGITAAALVVWMIERQLWTAPWRGVTFASAGLTLGQFGLGLLCVAAINFVLACSSAKTQQVTLNSSTVNAVQGQPLYAFLAVATCWLPSVLVARMGPDMSQNIKPAVAFVALSWLLHRIYFFTTKMNARHLIDEIKRKIPRLDRIATDEDDSKRLHRDFLVLLRKHLRWQDRGTSALFAASIVWALTAIGPAKGRLEEHLPTKRSVLSPLPEEGKSGAH